MKSVRVTLWRAFPPGLRRVTVRPVTVEAFMELVRIFARKAEEVVFARPDEEITDVMVIRAMREPEFLYFADAVAKDEESGWFKAWLSYANVMRLVYASNRVTNWPRLFALVDTAPKKRFRRGSMMSDVVAVAQVTQTPVPAVLALPAEQFLDIVAALNLVVQPEDPTEDETCEPDSVGSLAHTIPGLQVVN